MKNERLATAIPISQTYTNQQQPIPIAHRNPSSQARSLIQGASSQA